MATQVEGHLDWVTGVGEKGVSVLADVDLSMAVGYHDSPTGAGCLANAPFLMQRNLGYLWTWTQPGPGNEPYASVLMHG